MALLGTTVVEDDVPQNIKQTPGTRFELEKLVSSQDLILQLMFVFCFCFPLVAKIKKKKKQSKQVFKIPKDLFLYALLIIQCATLQKWKATA